MWAATRLTLGAMALSALFALTLPSGVRADEESPRPQAKQPQAMLPPPTVRRVRAPTAGAAGSPGRRLPPVPQRPATRPLTAAPFTPPQRPGTPRPGTPRPGTLLPPPVRVLQPGTQPWRPPPERMPPRYRPPEYVPPEYVPPQDRPPSIPPVAPPRGQPDRAPPRPPSLSSQPGSSQPGSSQPGSPQPGSSQPGSSQPGPPQRGTPRGSSEIEDTAPPRPSDGFDGDDFGGGVPSRPPPRPSSRPEPEAGDVGFRVARPGGALRVFRDQRDPKQNRLIIVMVGNPRIWRPAHTEPDGKGGTRTVDALSVKANSMVVWVDGRKFPGLAAYVQTDDEPKQTPESALDNTASVVPTALRGIYAQGAVELSFGNQRIRTDEIYIDPHNFRALMLKPRFDGAAKGMESLGGAPIPLHLRGRRARLLRRGFMVLDDAEVTTSRSDDRIALRVEELTVEEFAERVGPDGNEAAHFLGYQATSTQRYTAKTITVQGERLPLLWVPGAAFGGSDGGSGFPTTIERIRVISQPHLGRGVFVRFGTDVGPSEAPWFRLGAEIGGYTDRGWAGGLDARWEHLDPADPIRSSGYVESWFVLDSGTDRNGFNPPDSRYRVVSESRTFMGEDLQLDVGFAGYSDRGFNNEYFERDDLEHKDRESYARLRWEPNGSVVATLNGKWHQRGFETETTEEPALGLWVASAPLMRPARRGGFGLDLTSVSHAGRYGRRFDEDLSMADYGGWRLYSDTRVHGSANIGDARWSGYVGGVGAHYADLNVGAINDASRAALIYGSTLDLQMHRSWAAHGGLFELDGLRHVLDVRGGFEGRTGDRKTLGDIPFFDRFDLERDHQALLLRIRNRFQTRKKRPESTDPSTPTGAGVRNVLDFEVLVRQYLNDIAPYGVSSPGSVEWILNSRISEALAIQGDGLVDFRGGNRRAFINLQLVTELQDRPFTYSTGLRYVRSRIWAITNEFRWRYSDRYQFEGLAHLDFGEGQSVYRFIARRYSQDHAIAIGASYRDDSGFQFEFSLETAIGGRSESSIGAANPFALEFDPGGTFSDD